MSRLLLFMVFALWSVGGDVAPAHRASFADLLIFIGGYVVAISLMAIWARSVARRLPLHHLNRFNRGMWASRYFIVAWFALGMFVLNWPNTVIAILGPAGRWPIDSPAALLGTLPALLAWIGLICVQYPTDRAVREQNVSVELVSDLPVHAPPTLWSYLAANLRLELLFTLVPVAMILMLRDLGSLVIVGSGRFAAGSSQEQWADAVVSLFSAGSVFLIAPVVLRRVLHTRPLADSPLRRRLEAMCKNAGLGYREILLWHTDNHMGNAAVMGVLPMVRYILLSDLLLETMNDRQIEAVFAHELGHVAHKHLTWSGVFVVILLLALIGPGKWVGDISSAHLPAWAVDVLPAIEGIGGLLLLFGVLSRFFERQADVYAARTIEWINQTAPDQNAPHQNAPLLTAPDATGASPMTSRIISPITPAPAPPLTPRPSGSHVGEYGAMVFGSALYRVAVINNIPIASRTLTHGSISDRIEYLRSLSADPARTRRFDRFMVWVYIALIAGLATCGVWSAVVMMRP